MNGRYVLDTNIVIALFSNDETVINSVKESEEIIIPSIVIGELYYGAYNSKQTQENVSKIQRFSENVLIAECDSITAKLYGQIKTELKRKGLPIPENDIWIASLSIQKEAVLVSRDKHFKNISNLDVEIW